MSPNLDEAFRVNFSDAENDFILWHDMPEPSGHIKNVHGEDQNPWNDLKV